MKYITCIIIGYFLGCVNFAYIIGKLKGFDIREKGSGNAGASNVTIALGWGYGILTALLDIAKGYLAVTICRNMFPDMVEAPFLAGACAVNGHIFPFYMHFKGGKGFASYMGMLLAFSWKLALAMAIITVIITVVSNYISLATMSVSVLTPAYYLYKGLQMFPLMILVVLMILIIYKHRINIQRIINHEEIGLRDSGNHRVK
ncbi:MAG: glycerol-3-phosphate 1-O-acyltransferase PlsY [Erysipelotrichaceae bacterium]|nr:glycerol-3-phosphate 1-O-acyltransferase PlsY [Erysipelotrichaceae bacterium]